MNKSQNNLCDGFLVAIQFLTRLNVGQHPDLWSDENCGKSVKFFPLAGAVLGAAYFTAAVLFNSCGTFSAEVIAAFLLVLSLYLTGGIFYDGFMDSADGIFSGREREKILTIMKDSRVGANAVMAFTLLMLTEWSSLLTVSTAFLPLVVFFIPVIGRFAAVLSIVLFPYARPTGLGKAFHDFAPPCKTLVASLLTTLIFAIPLKAQGILALSIGVITALLFCRHAAKVLGGLTGDTYGAAANLAECAALLFFASTA